MIGPLITALAAAALFLFGGYVVVVSPRLSGGTLLGMVLMAIATFVIARLLTVAEHRHGVTR